jgi:hypothetical protein
MIYSLAGGVNMSGKHKAKYKRLDVGLQSGQLTLYVGQRVREALLEVTTDMDLYRGVRLGQVMEAVYKQGQKDGRKEVIEQFEEKIKEKANYLPPGQPRKKKKVQIKGGE